jgi:hypothetical protein
MNLHLKTILTILAFIAIGVVVSISAQHFPIFTIFAVAIFLFVAFYNLIYSLHKIERSINELRNK